MKLSWENSRGNYGKLIRIVKVFKYTPTLANTKVILKARVPEIVF